MTNHDESKISKKITLIVAIVSSFCSAYIMSSVNVALPVMGKQLMMTSVMQGWVNTSVLMTSTILTVPFGRLADIYGRRKIFIIGMSLQFIGTLLCGLAGSGASIILCRAIQGTGAAMNISSMIAIITSVFPGTERGKAMGISVAATYTGLATGPFLGGVLTQQLGWRSIFYLGALASAFAVVVAITKLKGEWKEAAGEKYDIKGSVIFIISLGVMMYGFTTLPSTTGFLLLIGGLIGFGIFIRTEGMVESPLLNVGILFRNSVFLYSNMATIINYSATFALSFLLSLYLQYIQGYSPQETGSILLINPVTMAVFAPFAGRLSDRFQPQIIASIGLGITCIALALFSQVGQGSSLNFIIGLLIGCGFATALFSTPNANAVMSSVEKRFLGVASGTMGTTRGIGMLFSMGIVMILFTVLMGGVQITPEYYDDFLVSMRVGFMIFTALSLIGMFSQIAGRRR